MRFAGRVGRALSEEVNDLSLRRSGMLAITGALPQLSFNRLRTRLVRLAGIEVGEGTVIGGAFTVAGQGGVLRIGCNCWINSGFHADLSAAVTIGNEVAIAQDVMIVTNTHVIGPPTRRAGELQSKPVTIDSGCWLGARAVILPGVTLGAGSIVAAGAVVIRDVPQDAVVGGVPAAIIRTL